MKNIDYINYIEKRIKEKFEGIELIEKLYEGQPNDAFLVFFEKANIRLSFIYDRGYINGEIIKGDEHIPYWKINNSLTNLWLKDTENIDKIIDYLFEHRNRLFPEWI